MDTLGSLIDRLIVGRLKAEHSSGDAAIAARAMCLRVRGEVDKFLADVASGRVPPDEMAAPECKVYRSPEGPRADRPDDTVGSLTEEMAALHGEVWHLEEKAHDVSLGEHERFAAMEKICVLNVRRHEIKDRIDMVLRGGLGGGTV